MNSPFEHRHTMNSLPLNQYQLKIERFKNRIRIVVLHEAQEIVCRKETEKNLMNFLHNNDESLFKGRLQLMKDDSFVTILVKSIVVGKVTKADFIHLINKVNT